MNADSNAARVIAMHRETNQTDPSVPTVVALRGEQNTPKNAKLKARKKRRRSIARQPS
jgi:hypothetical protein